MVLLGDYGSGKTVVIQSVAEKLKNTDKHLVYINALDTQAGDKTYCKKWEDVLDVIVKLRFRGVAVLDIGTMRRQYIGKYNGKNVSFLF